VPVLRHYVSYFLERLIQKIAFCEREMYAVKHNLFFIMRDKQNDDSAYDHNPIRTMQKNTVAVDPCKGLQAGNTIMAHILRIAVAYIIVIIVFFFLS